MNLKCISLNIRGINKAIKRRNLFRWLHNGKYDVIFLQETYSDKTIENVWRAEWGGDIFYSHGSKHSRGVMTLMRPTVKGENISTTCDRNGRVLIVNLTIQDEEFCLANIYAPNDQNLQVDFYTQLTRKLRPYVNSNLGSLKCHLGVRAPFNIAWPEQYVLALGVAFAYDSTTSFKINFEEKLVTLRNILNQWTARNLTLIGRICIVKTLAISKLVYNTSVLKVPPNFAEKVNDICFQFIWNYKPDKVKRQTIVLPVDKGGLNMVDFTILDKSLKDAWVKRFCEADGSKWCSVFSSVIAQYGGRFIFECNFDIRDLNLTSRVPSFYRDILTVWQELHSKNPSTTMEYPHETIWNNRFIRIDGKPVFYSSWYKKGVTKIHHLLNERGTFLSRSDFQRKYGLTVNFLTYNGILAATPGEWKKSILNSELLDNSEGHNLMPANVTAKAARKMFVLKRLEPPNVERKLVEQNISTKAVYELPFNVTMENKLRCFQYKVVHNILPTNSNLYNMKLRTSPSCDRCSHPRENLFHLLYECPSIQFFWQKVISWWNEKRSENVTLSALDILYGYKPESNLFQALNHYVIIAKYHIFLSWLNKTSPSFGIFCVLLNEKILCERTIAFKNNTLSKFKGKWGTLCA